MFPGGWYDEDYWDRPGTKSGFAHPYQWHLIGSQFADTAQHIAASFHPATVLDVGCGRGFLVAALRHLGIEATGIDLSAYAVGTAHPDAADHVRVADVTADLLPGPADLVVCFDVLEHLPAETVPTVLTKLAGAASEWIVANIGLDGQDDGSDPSHINLQTRGWWVEAFAEWCPGFVLVDGFGSNVWWFNTPAMSFTLQRSVSVFEHAE
jgi:SAM-dependent methyltransferase